MIFTQHHSGSAGNLYQLSSGQSSILIDPGVPIKKIKHALDFRLHSIEAALVSHSHLDHSVAVPELMRAGIDCYMTSETADALGLSGHRLQIIEPGKQIQIGSWSVVAFKTQHDFPGSVGFLISDGKDKLLFATDTFYIIPRFKGVTIIAIECNYSKETLADDLDPVRKARLYKSHFSLENVKKFLLANDISAVKEIHLIHMSRDNADQEMFQDEIQKLTGKPVYIK